jgi:allantoin racemase
MPRILILNPVSTDIWNELAYNYCSKIVDPDTEIHVKNLSNGPRAIEYDYDREIAAPYVVEEVIKANKEGFDAIVINCFDDPGLDAAREVSDKLVLGIGESSITTALLLGHRIAIISTGRQSIPIYHRKAMTLGIEGRIVHIAGIDVGVLDIRKDIDNVKEILLGEIERSVRHHGAEVVVLGCGGFIGLAEELSTKTKVPVIDPTMVTVKLAESLTRLRLMHSKVLRRKSLADE